MPVPPPRTAPARVPNFSYDTGPRDLNLLDSAVQRDMARTKRVAPGSAAARPQPFAVDSSGPSEPMRVQKRKIEPRASRSWSPPRITTRRCNHLQNSPSQWKAEKCKVQPGTSLINTGLIGGAVVPADAAAASRQPFSTRRDRPKVVRSRINEGSNLFGPPVSPYGRAPPPAVEPFVQRQRGGHIRPTLLGMTDAYKFADKKQHHHDMMRDGYGSQPSRSPGRSPRPSPARQPVRHVDAVAAPPPY
eukprot:TRINITY_DN1124_c3_g1_i1.p1 TRINITY_DN1124_c3_g1~~TRINITY_DN1124_c3_g1_i1.p1  ORF type:complete len:277 (+),score=54.45 TRINITY_DN1124_c3_g1_i1:95-832(+)